MRAFAKYGLDSFEMELIEECQTLDELNEAEIKWIKEMDTITPNGYNILAGGKNNTWTEEMKEKMRQIQQNRSPEWQENLRKGLQKRGQSWRDNISKSRINMKLSPKQLESLKLGRQTGRKGMVGENNPRSKVTEDMVREIRLLYATGDYSQQKLSDKFGINQAMVSKIIRRDSWKHVE